MKKTKLINLRVSEDMHKKYMEVADIKGIDLSKLIRQLLNKEVLENDNNKNKHK